MSIILKVYLSHLLSTKDDGRNPRSTVGAVTEIYDIYVFILHAWVMHIAQSVVFIMQQTIQ